MQQLAWLPVIKHGKIPRINGDPGLTGGSFGGSSKFHRPCRDVKLELPCLVICYIAMKAIDPLNSFPEELALACIQASGRVQLLSQAASTMKRKSWIKEKSADKTPRKQGRKAKNRWKH